MLEPVWESMLRVALMGAGMLLTYSIVKHMESEFFGCFFMYSAGMAVGASYTIGICRAYTNHVKELFRDD